MSKKQTETSRPEQSIIDGNTIDWLQMSTREITNIRLANKEDTLAWLGGRKMPGIKTNASSLKIGQDEKRKVIVYYAEFPYKP